MKIGIDARLYGLSHSGIGRYVMELVHWLTKLDHNNQYVLFTRSQNSQDLPSQRNVKKVIADIRHYTLKEQLQLPGLIRRESLDIIHFPHFNVPLLLPVPFLVTIHDLLWHQVIGYKVTTLNPLTYSAKYLAYRATVKSAVKRSRLIFTPSKWVKSQILKRFHVKPQKIVVTYEGVGRAFKQTTAKKQSFKIKKPFIVYTGSLYPHKNVNTLIKALMLLNRKSLKKTSLALVSAPSIFTSKTKRLVSRLGQNDYVTFTGFLPDQALRSLYQEAAALVQPSTSEGFGLTGLESMAAGTPVISSKAGSLPEIYEEAALYFNPQDEKDLSEKIRRLVSDSKLRDGLIDAGIKQSKEYSWKKMAQQTLAMYQEVGQTIKSEQ